MAELQRQFGAAVTGFVDSNAVQLALRLVAIYLIAVWLAAAWWAFRDAENRTGSRAASYLAAAWVILFSPVFFPLALLVYRLVRPPELLADVQDRRLTEAALLAETLDEPISCPRCSRLVEADWVACPTCRLVLAQTCSACGRAARLDWTACAWCGNVLENAGAAAAEQGHLPAIPRRAPVLAAAAAGPVAVNVEIPPDLDVEPPAFIAPRARPRRLRPVERRLRKTAASRQDGQPADRQTA